MSVSTLSYKTLQSLDSAFLSAASLTSFPKYRLVSKVYKAQVKGIRGGSHHVHLDVQKLPGKVTVCEIMHDTGIRPS